MKISMKRCGNRNFIEWKGKDKMNQQMPTTLKHYVERYRMDKRLLSENPENKELLEKRISNHEKSIIEYVTSDSFQTQLNYLNL